MDLNYLYHRQQVSHFMAANAACSASRLAHAGLGAGYTALIDEAKRSSAKPAGPKADPRKTLRANFAA